MAEQIWVAGFATAFPDYASGEDAPCNGMMAAPGRHRLPIGRMRRSSASGSRPRHLRRDLGPPKGGPPPVRPTLSAPKRRWPGS